MKGSAQIEACASCMPTQKALAQMSQKEEANNKQGIGTIEACASCMPTNTPVCSNTTSPVCSNTSKPKALLGSACMKACASWSPAPEARVQICR
jgi:hypothetical protein